MGYASAIHNLYDLESNTKRRKRNPKGIYPGDTIKIINPEFIIRIGYDVYIKDEAKKIIEDYSSDILNLIKKVNPLNYNSLLSVKHGNSQISKIAYALAGARIKKATGDRKLFTGGIEALRDKTKMVEEVFFRKIGTYYPSSGSYEDYDPPMLVESRTVRILVLDGYGINWDVDAGFVEGNKSRPYYGLCIDSENVELLMGDKLDG